MIELLISDVGISISDFWLNWDKTPFVYAVLIITFITIVIQ